MLKCTAAARVNMTLLLSQVDAGGDFVVTQLFYDVDVFLRFVEDCRSVGIDVPIIPGMPSIVPAPGVDMHHVP